MKWVPPRSLVARLEWAKAHPWIAGFYFGLFMFIFGAFLLPALAGTSADVRFEVLVGAAGGAASGMFTVLALKRGWEWGRRPDAENYPAPTARRMWARYSDRLLLWMMLLGVAFTVSAVFGLITRSDNSWRVAYGIAVGVWLSSTTWREHQRRRSTA